MGRSILSAAMTIRVATPLVSASAVGLGAEVGAIVGTTPDADGGGRSTDAADAAGLTDANAEVGWRVDTGLGLVEGTVVAHATTTSGTMPKATIFLSLTIVTPPTIAEASHVLASGPWPRRERARRDQQPPGWFNGSASDPAHAGATVKIRGKRRSMMPVIRLHEVEGTPTAGRTTACPRPGLWRMGGHL